MTTTYALSLVGQLTPRQQRINLDGSIRRAPVVRLITDDATTHAATGITVTGTIASLSGGNTSGVGASFAFAGTLSGSALTTGTYSNGASFNGLTLTITAGSGYCQSSGGQRVKVAFSGGGATTQATGYANTTASGAITSLTIVTGGSGYSSTPTVTIPSNSDSTLLIDLGTFADQYREIAYSSITGAASVGIDLLVLRSMQDDGVSGGEYLAAAPPATQNEAYFTAMTAQGSAVRRAILSGSRYVQITVHPTLDFAGTARAYITLYPT